MVGEGCDECGKHKATYVCNGGMYLCDTHAKWHMQTGHTVERLPYPMDSQQTMKRDLERNRA